MNNVLVGIGVLVFAALAALFAVPYFVDWNRYRGVFEEEASRVVGRDVRVGGAVNLRLLPAPYLSFKKIRVADSETSSGEPFFRADSMDIRLSLAPLLRGVIEASEIELRRPVVRLSLDAKGGGNWQSLGRGDATLPFVPKDIALQSVRIIEGTLTVMGADQAERLRLEGIQGEFGAPSIDGPYRFRGSFGGVGQEREVRFATAKAEADGGVRFKGTVKRADLGTSLSLDGRLFDLTTVPRLEGDLAAEMPLPRRRTAGKVAEPPVEIRAKVAADFDTARLSDLTIGFEQSGQPQVLSGVAEVTLRGGLAVATSLSARWLDFDQLIGVGEAQSPLTALVDFIADLNGLASDIRRSATVVSVDQANLGREAVSGVSLSVKGFDGETRIEELRLGLPGGSRADLSGRLTGSGDKTGFEGHLTLRGASVARLAAWATAGAVTIAPARDGSFAVRTRINVAPGTVLAQDLVGELTGTSVQGDIGYRWHGRKNLTVKLDGPRVDLRTALTENFSLGNAIGLLTQGVAGSDIDLKVHLRTGQLLLPGQQLRDVVTDFEVKDRALRIGKLKLAAGAGIQIDVEGDVVGLSTRPKGALRGFVAVNEAAGFDLLWSLIDWPDALKPSLRQQSAMAPLRLAGSIAFGRQTTSGVEVSADGTANRVRVRFASRLSESLALWRDRPVDSSLTLEADDPVRILNLIGASAASRAGEAAQARLDIKAIGIPAQDLATLATLEAGDTIMSYRGNFNSGEKGIGLAGDLTARADNGARVMQLLGMLPRTGLDGVPLEGSARIVVKDKTTIFEQLALSVGPAKVGGRLVVASEGESRSVKGRLDISTLPVAALFTMVTAASPGAVVGRGIDITSGRTGPWPEQAFDFAALQSVTADVELRANRLLLGDGLVLSQARGTLVGDAVSLELRSLEGSGIGGRWSGLLKLSNAGAQGAALSGLLRTTNARLEAILPAGTGAATAPSGVFNGVLTLNGRGLSPRGLISGLSGSGSIDLGQARFQHLTTFGATAAVDAAMGASADTMQSVVRQKLLAGRDGTTITFGPRVMPFDIAEGVARLRPIAIDLTAGRIFAEARVDLANLAFGGDWRVEALLSPPAGSAKSAALLPPISFSYSGPLAAFGRIEPRLDSDRLEQELTVRKMERDVEELERLRKLDEERAKDEAAKRAQAPTGSMPASLVPAPAIGFGTVTIVPAPAATGLDAATTPTAIPDPPSSISPPVAAQPRESSGSNTSSPSPKYRPLGAEEMKRIFGSGG